MDAPTEGIVGLYFGLGFRRTCRSSTGPGVRLPNAGAIQLRVLAWRIPRLRGWQAPCQGQRIKFSSL